MVRYFIKVLFSFEVGSTPETELLKTAANGSYAIDSAKVKMAFFLVHEI